MSPSSPNALLREIGRDIVSQIAPKELPIFQAASEAYFADPRHALSKGRSKDDVLGFGLEPFGIVLTPIVLHLLAEVVEFLTDVAKKAVASGLEKGVSDLVSSMFRRRSGPAASILTVNQIAAVRARGLLAAKRLKLPPEKAELLVDAITAELVATQGRLSQMSIVSPSGSGTARLNPFAFPSDTSFRFGLLLVFIMSGTIEFAGDIWSVLRSAQNRGVEVCAKAALLDFGSSIFGASSLNNGDQLAELNRQSLPALMSCITMLRPKGIWSLAAILVATAVTLTIYSALPFIKRTQQRLVPLTACDMPELSAELHRLCEQTGLVRPPTFVWNPLSAAQPVAFGSWGWNCVSLSGGFVVHSFFGDLSSFRAIVLHELAHIRNGDVAKAYLAIAACLTFILTSVFPALSLTILSGPKMVELLELSLNMALWTAIIVLSGLSVLRAREYYADVRASVWDGATGAIEGVLGRSHSTAWGNWRRHLAFHPDPTDRRRVVADPAILFRLGLWDAFGVGLAAWSVVGSVNSLLLDFMPRSSVGAFLVNGAMIFVTPAVAITFAVGALGIAVWRAAFAALIRGADPYRGTGSLALAMTSGYLLIVGVNGLLSWLAFMSDPAVSGPTLLVVLQLQMFTGVIWTMAGVLIFRWLPAAASAWLPVVLRSQSPSPAIAASVAVAVALLAVVFGSGITVVGSSLLFIRMPTFRGELYSYALLVGTPLLLGTIAAWSFPLTATLWPTCRSQTSVANWAFLDTSAVALLTQEPLRLRSAAAVGLAAGLAYCTLMGAVYFRNYFPDQISGGILAGYLALSRLANDWFGSPSTIIHLLAVMAQAFAAGVAAIKARWLSPLCGLFASSVAALVISLFDGWLFGFATVGIFVASVLLGAIVALPVAILVALGKACLHRLRAVPRQRLLP